MAVEIFNNYIQDKNENVKQVLKRYRNSIEKILTTSKLYSNIGGKPEENLE